MPQWRSRSRRRLASFSLPAGIPPHPDTPSAGTLQPQSIPRLRRQMSGRANAGFAPLHPCTQIPCSLAGSRSYSLYGFKGRVSACRRTCWKTAERPKTCELFRLSGVSPHPDTPSARHPSVVKHPKTLAGSGRASRGGLSSKYSETHPRSLDPPGRFLTGGR